MTNTDRDAAFKAADDLLDAEIDAARLRFKATNHDGRARVIWRKEREAAHHAHDAAIDAIDEQYPDAAS